MYMLYTLIGGGGANVQHLFSVWDKCLDLTIIRGWGWQMS